MEWNQMIPEFDVFNLNKTLDFYIRLIGFNMVYDRKEDKFAFLQLEKIQIMLQEFDFEDNKWRIGKMEYPLGRGINFQMEVENIDEIYNKLRNDNYSIFVTMKENWYRQDNYLLGCKEFLVLDPNGYCLRFSQDIGKKHINL